MQIQDALALSPYIALTLSAVAIMIGIAVRRYYGASFAIAIAGFVAALFLLPTAAAGGPHEITALLSIDRYALFFAGLIIASALVVALLSHNYFERREQYPDEFYILLTLATLGAAIMPASKHFISFYLGLEVLSVSLYAMIGYARENLRSTEAAVKYLIIAAAATAFLLFGMALIYADLGAMDFASIASGIRTRPTDILLMSGLALFLAGVGFKLSLVPFHMWTPDVYDGAPAPVTAYIATVSKAAMFAPLLRYFLPVGLFATPLHAPTATVAVASMFVGNLLALRQTNLKRMLAYSSIAHVGYMLVALLAGDAGRMVVPLYLTAYFVTTLGAFGAVTLASRRSLDEDCADLDAYRGLLRRDPITGVALAAMMLSLAGIPLTAGFIGKFFIILWGVNSGLWWLLGALVINSAIGLFYYLRVAYLVCAPSKNGSEASISCACLGERLGLATLCALIAVLLWIGALPNAWLSMIGASALPQ